MMRKSKSFLALLALLILALCSVQSVLAIPEADPSQKVYDYAALFSASEQQELYRQVCQFIDAYQLDMAIVTIDDDEGMSSMAYADDFFDYNGFGIGEDYDGLLLLLNMDYREIWISTCGLGIDYFSDAAIERMLDSIYEEMVDGDYFGAGRVFISEASRWAAGQGSYRLAVEEWLGISLLGGAIATLIIIGVMYLMHRQSLPAAASLQHYLVGAVTLTHQVDTFMHTHTSRTAIPKSNSSGGGSSTHRSSSGRSHGGGGRRF